MNDKVVNDASFPKLNYLEHDKSGNDFVAKGRILINHYFPNYTGRIFDLFELDSELNELFAVSANSLAFLIRFSERVAGELLVANEHNYRSNLNVYPRFNNAIAETAGYIYNIWERITFILNEFFPKQKNNVKFPPSFEQYFTSKNKELENKKEFLNDEFLWFYKRLDVEHVVLGSLRHPLVHYNKFRIVKGMRSAKFVSEFHSIKDMHDVIQQFTDETCFLKQELFEIDIALRKALLLIEKWASL